MAKRGCDQLTRDAMGPTWWRLLRFANTDTRNCVIWSGCVCHRPDVYCRAQAIKGGGARVDMRPTESRSQRESNSPKQNFIHRRCLCLFLCSLTKRVEHFLSSGHISTALAGWLCARRPCSLSAAPSVRCLDRRPRFRRAR